KIARFNLTHVSSIYPPQCKIVPVNKGVTKLKSGQVIAVVIARNETNENRRLVATSIGVAIPSDKNQYGYLSEHHSYGQTEHQAWLIPMIEAGWIAYLSTTDAVCYHDGHRSLQKANPVFEVPIFTDDGALRDEGTIRVTDMAFEEKVLFDEDRFVSAVLMRPEFQKKMTGTELRFLLGRIYGDNEKKLGVQPGLLSTCTRLAIPILVGAPG